MLHLARKVTENWSHDGIATTAHVQQIPQYGLAIASHAVFEGIEQSLLEMWNVHRD